MVGPSGYNPTRRNKNIATSAQGFKKRNAFDIPSSSNDERAFYTKLIDPVEIECSLSRHYFTCLVEPVKTGFRYYLSVSDVIEVLKLIPEADRVDVKVIAFRQPKRKERIFSSVWGRMAYWTDFGQHRGTSIVIEALPLNYSYRLEKNLEPYFAKEIEALRQDGHMIDITKRHIEINCPPEAIRTTQAFRTLPHEIGHSLDYQQKVDRPYERGEADYETLRGLYFARPKLEREAFADRYADSVMAPFRQRALIPFSPLPNLSDTNLKPEWFYFEGQCPSK
jgi:hypothetical protein